MTQPVNTLTRLKISEELKAVTGHQNPSNNGFFCLPRKILLITGYPGRYGTAYNDRMSYLKSSNSNNAQK